MKNCKGLLLLALLVIMTLSLGACGITGGGSEGLQEDTYEVVFDGTSISDRTIKEGEKLSQPFDPIKINYIFGGWYTDSSYKNEALFPMIINKDTTIYALFYDNKTDFNQTRKKSIGSNVAGFEYDYTIDASASYSTISLKENTTETQNTAVQVTCLSMMST